ncbi:MAG: tRNA pseudouridine(38-40) synthase TruA [Ruminococcus sp.]|nr:tRNA pseudouridine(38-40) synthase TruA [Ruminococcus sp.]
MRNIKAVLSYRGTNYHGFQRQNNAVSVQGVIEDRLSRVCNEEIKVNGCSRTDSGVHAAEYVISFNTSSNVPCENMVRGMNSLLPCDISIKSCEEAAADFHARYSCKGKEYVYRILNRPNPSPFMSDLCFHYPYNTDIDLMNRAAAYFKGKHDFSAFCGALGKKENSLRTVYESNVERRGDIITFTVSGDGFLYNMVRIMAGTLIYVNEGKISPEDVPDIIERRDRERAGVTAKACGLYLNKVFY